MIGNRVVYDKRRCITALNRLMCDGVLSPQEASKYRKILNKRTLTLEDHILLKENLNYHKIRFKPNQVLTGYVPLQNKTIWRLMDGFKRGITKVDVIAWIDGVGYREFTMI